MRAWTDTIIMWTVVLAVLGVIATAASNTYSRDQRVIAIRAECFRQDGYYRQFGDTAFCMTSRGHERTILWEKKV